MRRKAKKNRKQERETHYIILLTALINLLTALIGLVSKYSE